MNNSTRVGLWLDGTSKHKAEVSLYAPRQSKKPPRIVLHTTETKTLPSYSGGKSAPHLTVGVGDAGSLSLEKQHKIFVWQHFPLDFTARSLRHSGVDKRNNQRWPETNHMGSHCVQIEMITYVKNNRGKLPALLIEAAAQVVQQISDAIPEIDLTVYPKPSRWVDSNAASEYSAQRMTTKEWENFNGICGHQHVPGNTHWDPGAFDIEAFVALVTGATMVTPVATSEEAQAWPRLLKSGDRSPRVKVVRAALQGLGYGELSGSDLYNANVIEAVKRLQTSENITADGIWGPETHKHVQDRIAVQLDRTDQA